MVSFDPSGLGGPVGPVGPVGPGGPVELDAADAAAGMMILLALGCFIQDIFGSIDAGSGRASAEQLSSVVINDAVYVAAFVAMTMQAMRYFATAKGLADSKLLPLNPLEKLRFVSPIFYALGFVEAVELLVGFGTPYAGDDLADGAQRLTELHRQLGSAFPDGGWQGVGAQRYTDQVSAVQGATRTLADVDTYLAHAAQHQGEWVTHLRVSFGLIKAILLLAHFIEREAMDSGVKDARGWASDWALKAAAAGVAAAVAMDYRRRGCVVCVRRPRAGGRR